MKILLIGATGQIGYALTQALSQTAHQVSILVRDKHKLAFPENVRTIESQEFSPDAFSTTLRNVDCVIYGAGLPEQFSFDTGIFQRVNYDIFKTFLESLNQSPVRRLIYISTYEVFQSIDGIIRETHPIADPRTMSPYFKSMIQAYRLAIERANEMNLKLTTIHPAAVYGGRNTGDGFTNYIENLLNRRFSRVPVIIDGRFPVVHADSLANAIVRALDRPGAYIVSDQMTSLKEIAQTLREHSNSYIPPTVPKWMAYASSSVLEFYAKRLNIKPVMARVQIEYITKGWEPRADRARTELGWQPMSLGNGIRTYLEDRKKLLGN